MASPAQLSKTERLRMYARPLKPERFPFYVQHATEETPMMGWWWQPAGADSVEPLAAGYEAALFRLHALRETVHA